MYDFLTVLVINNQPLKCRAVGNDNEINLVSCADDKGNEIKPSPLRRAKLEASLYRVARQSGFINEMM